MEITNKKDRPRKVFISVLGTGVYEKCCYFKEKKEKDKDFESKETCFIQEASLQYLGVREEWSQEDLGLFLLTKKARKDNWDKSITEREKWIGDKKEKVEYKGLEKILEDLSLPIQIKELNIPDGNNEEEIWDIFTKVFDQLKDDDELYFDVTHAFRYLPMLILVLCNYSKFLKNIKVMSITYGNYEARDKESNKAPIIDLLPLTILQDWTYAAGTYMDSGNVDKLVDLSYQKLLPILKGAKGTDEVANNLKTFIKYLDYVIEERQTCRGMDIIGSQNFGKLKRAADRISILESAIPKTLKPLVPVIGKIKDSFAGFDENENINNGYFSARWCFNNKLYQQAATILEEVVVSYFCARYEIPLNARKKRGVVNDAFHIK